MIHPRFFYFVSNASLAVVLGFAPLVGHAQPPLDFSGALPGGLSAGLITTPAPEVAALTVEGFESIPDAVLAYLCTYFSEDERCSRTRRISKSFDKAVTETLRLQYPLEEMIHAIPSSLRDKATTLKIVNHAMAPLRAIQLIEDYQGIRRSRKAFKEKFPNKPEKKLLIRKLKHLAVQLYEDGYSQQFVLALLSWIKQDATPEVRKELRRLVKKLQNQVNLSDMPLTYDFLAFCQLRGIGMEKNADFEKNSFIECLQTLKKESKLSQKMLPLIRSLKLNDYLTLKAQLWPMVTKVKTALLPKVDLPPLTVVELECFQTLKETNLLDVYEAYHCARFFRNQEDLVRALSFYTYSAGLGDSACQVHTGRAYKHGRGTQANEDTALYYHQLATSQNFPDAHWGMGKILIDRNRQGDPDLALYHLSQAAELYQTGKKQSDYLKVLVEIAYLHLWGHLTSPDPELGLRYLHQAEGGKSGKNTFVYLYLAFRYYEARAVKKHLETAFDYLDKATAEGTAEHKALAEKYRKIWTDERKKGLENASDIETEFSFPIFHEAPESHPFERT